MSHESLIREMRRFSLPQTFVDYVVASITDSSTSILVDKVLSDPIAINRGIKQGDPLSPFLLFNLVVGELLTELDAKSEGLTVGNRSVGPRAVRSCPWGSSGSAAHSI